MNKVLIITYYWPPSGGAGVQRWLKFSRYLLRFGWQPVILTVEPEFAAYPAIDKSLEKEIPEDIIVYRTKATDWFRIYGNKSNIPSAGFAVNNDDSFKGKISRFLRGNFFIPDPRKGWNKFAFRKACELISQEKINQIITTSPPHSTQLIGLRLKKKFPQIKWIADLRDPWTNIYYYNKFYPTLISKSIDKHYEKTVLKTSDRIITVSNSFKESFCSLVPSIEKKFSIIPNGYDELDFEDIKTHNPERFTISYVGTISGSYPINGLLAALKQIHDEDIDFNLRFAGEINEKFRNQILSLLPQQNIEFNSYMSHQKAIRFMTGSSLLILLIPDHQSNSGIIPGKLFEYLASGKPILCLGPADGDSATIIESTKAGKTFHYDDIQGISGFIKSTVTGSPDTKAELITQYSRINLAGKVAAVLNGLNI
jgi:glycosyltransferase involved in cell wall biosynthesis